MRVCEQSHGYRIRGRRAFFNDLQNDLHVFVLMIQLCARSGKNIGELDPRQFRDDGGRFINGFTSIIPGSLASLVAHPQ